MTEIGTLTGGPALPAGVKTTNPLYTPGGSRPGVTVTFTFEGVEPEVGVTVSQFRVDALVICACDPLPLSLLKPLMEVRTT